MEFIELNGAALRYELTGKGDRTLVLIHEMGGSTRGRKGDVDSMAAAILLQHALDVKP